MAREGANRRVRFVRPRSPRTRPSLAGRGDASAAARRASTSRTLGAGLPQPDRRQTRDLMTSRLGVLVLLAACASRGGPAGRALADREATPVPPIDRAAMAERVRDETRRSWNAYVRYAWGHDELRPVTHTARDWYGAPLLITPVDALDTLVMMGLSDEANAARS